MSLTPHPCDHCTQLTCRADFRAGVTVQNTIQLRVACAPRDLVIPIFHDNTQESPRKHDMGGVHKGHFLGLLCTVADRPPTPL
ncbi:PREDICTED: sialic acid-binding Ig-like lectin 11 [Dipodomys ordii]|uniref:Sialic acid-binding Ig-like lectin 11 n=1 Tax=Dipodomys ordii TaxID=10020 RepID=A0A1S3G4V7_DIPOR|nr:PREDICTED: sialic acid-binding Ig-like lectin 11 [Dipodomys ordii]